MYDELIKALRETDFSDGCPCEAEPVCASADCIIAQAADAIEELQKAVMRLEEESGLLDELPMYQQPVGWIPVPPHGRLIEEADAIETAWMILRGLGYRRDENPQLEQAVRDVFATALAI